MRRGRSEDKSPQIGRRSHGVRDEKEEQEERQETSCQQEPSLSKGKIKRQESSEKTFAQAQTSTAKEITARDRRDGKSKRRNSASLCGTTEGTVSPRRLIGRRRWRLQRPLASGRGGFREP